MNFQKTRYIVESFSKDERKLFRKFISSIYFNTNEDLILTFDIILKFTELSTSKLSLEEYLILGLKKENKKFGKIRIQKQVTSINKLANLFLSIESFQKDKIGQKLNLLKVYLEKSDKNAFVRLSISLRKEINNWPDSTKKFKYIDEIEELNWFYKSTVTEKRKDGANLLARNKSFDKYYISERLWIAIAIENRKYMVSNFGHAYDYQALIEKIERDSWLEDKYIKALYLAFNMLRLSDHKKLKYFELFSQHISKHHHQFGRIETNHFFSLLGSEAIKIYNDEKELYAFLFKHYNQLIDEKILYGHNNSLHYTHVKNIVTAAVKTNRLPWAENFIKEHKELIMPIEYKKVAYFYNLAKVYFFQKKFDKAFDLLYAYDIENIKDNYYEISTKRLKLMLSFEKMDWVQLNGMINTYAVSLSKHRMPNVSIEHKERETNFINFFKRLYRVYSQYKLSANNLDKLKISLDKYKIISERDWLNEKVMALKN